MSVSVTVKETAEWLLSHRDILILTHQYPDGDTLGSAMALCRALAACGIRAKMACSHAVPKVFSYLFEDFRMPDFEPQAVCAVDVADTSLLGEPLIAYAGRIGLCIDHHGSNIGYADKLLLKGDYAATAMIVYEVIAAMGVSPDRAIAECLYTGIATDTGCFKYSNCTAQVHRMAAELMDIGIRYDMINRLMFDTKSRARVELERMALENITYHLGGRCAVMVITDGMIASSGAENSDLEGLSPLPRQIEGVWVGVTIRVLDNNDSKISVRTDEHADASAICAAFGGGGHARAAGCIIAAPVSQAVQKLLAVIAQTAEGITSV